jgi:16S rRNA (uracil1498-N3)-methyltransferase
MNDPRPRARLYVDSALSAGVDIILPSDQAHYVARVMRLGTGDSLALFDGANGEWRATITDVTRNSITARVDSCLRPQAAPPDVWLAFAPVKRLRIDYLVAKATELGAASLLPVFTRRTAVARVKQERLLANAVEASEQCGRLTVPAIRPAEGLADMLAAWPPERRLLLLDETGGPPIVPTLHAARAEMPSGATAPWGILCGPEGGFDPSELDAIGKLAFVTRVGLGPRILRAETAALAALTCWQAVLGDWAQSAPVRDPGTS